MNITQDVFVLGTGCTAATADAWLPSMQSAMDEFSINTPSRIAAFLANVGVESGSFTNLTENCNYSSVGLAMTWPNRYAVDPAAIPKTPNALAEQLNRDPKAIANNCYANRMGNGDEASGDGWNYRGQGPIQITGKANIAKCGAAIGVDLLSDPTALQSPPNGARSAAWFFSSVGCNEKADSNDIVGVVKLINGQVPCQANNGATRISRYHATLDALNAS